MSLWPSPSRPWRLRVLAEFLAALGDALFVDERGHVVPDRRREFRLLADEARGIVRLEIAGGRLDRRLIDARGCGGLLQTGKAGGPVGASGGGNAGQKQCEKQPANHRVM